MTRLRVADVILKHFFIGQWMGAKSFEKTSVLVYYKRSEEETL